MEIPQISPIEYYDQLPYEVKRALNPTERHRYLLLKLAKFIGLKTNPLEISEDGRIKEVQDRRLVDTEQKMSLGDVACKLGVTAKRLYTWIHNFGLMPSANSMPYEYINLDLLQILKVIMIIIKHNTNSRDYSTISNAVKGVAHLLPSNQDEIEEFINSRIGYSDIFKVMDQDVEVSLMTTEQ